MLLPPDLRQWLEEGHLAYFIIDIVEELDLSQIYASYDGSRGGRPGFDPRLLHSMCTIESRFNPQAVSPKGARGPFQLIDATADRFLVQDPFNPEENLLGALRYLRFLLGLYGDRRLDLILAAYNCGEECVERFGRRVPPIPETRSYVNNVLKLYRQSI